MKQICESCGQTFDDRWMMSYNSGRKTHWFCWSCWKAGQGEAVCVEVRRRREQIREGLKRK